MCGIAAQFRPGGPARRLDLARLRHRGPDSSGEWWSPDESVWLGHTRLAIVDLSERGAQPMHDPATGNAIVFNGEIYNHRQLRARLSDQPVNWQSESDTETLLVAYRVWGRRMFSRLKGMFAFVIYDARSRALVLGRDRFGMKPLCFIKRDKNWSFASETRMLRACGDGSPSRSSIAAYLQLGASPENELIFPEIKSFPAGHWMEIADDGNEQLECYWPPKKFSPACLSDPPARVRELLEFSVEEHLLSDVPVAAFLSGGIDSSIITALAAQKSSGALDTFSVGFQETRFDETAIAEAVARRYGTRHHRIELTRAETLQLVCEAVDRLDLPSVDAINTYIVSRKVAQHGIKVALSGLGGDELFGGYPSFRDVPRLKWLARLPRFVLPMLHLFGATGRRLADVPNADAADLALWRRRFWSDAMLDSSELPRVEFGAEVLPELPDDYARISWVELTRYMRHLLLRDSDQMSMAVSLELRLPFLDHELVEYVLALPAQEKKRHGRLKGLLIESCRDLLPREVYQRPKMGFGLPMDEWMRGPLARFVKEGLTEVVSRGVLAGAGARQVAAGFDRGDLHWTRLWSVVVLGHYLRKISNETEPACGFYE